MELADAIEAIAAKTSSNWHTVLLALTDRELVNPKQQKEIEAHFSVTKIAA